MMRRVSWLPSAPLRPGKTRSRRLSDGLGLPCLLALLALRLRREVHGESVDVPVSRQLDSASSSHVGDEPTRGAEGDAVARVDQARHGEQGRSTSASWKGMAHFRWRPPRNWTIIWPRFLIGSPLAER